MGFVARGALAGAVSKAGGLGVIGAGSNMTRDEIKAEIDAVRAITDKPFGVDILFATVRAEGDVAARYTEAVQEMVDVVIEEGSGLDLRVWAAPRMPSPPRTPPGFMSFPFAGLFATRRRP